MSHIPNAAMPHAHAEPTPDVEALRGNASKGIAGMLQRKPGAATAAGIALAAGVAGAAAAAIRYRRRGSD